MPDTNDLSTDSAVSQLTIDLCRELYDRFVMGGWMPQDAHAQTEAMIRQCFDTPAADAGPRQPECPICNQPMSPQSSCALGYCNLLDGEHVFVTAPPVPQEAAPEPQMAANPQRKGTPHAVEHRHTIACHAPPRCKRVEAATAPDEAMRVAREKAFTIRWHSSPARYTVSIPCYDGEVVPLEDVAALIREAGSREKIESMTLATEPCPDCGSSRHRSCDVTATAPDLAMRVAGDCADNDPLRECRCGGQRGKPSCMFPESELTRVAAQPIDWQQVVSNGGPPCFYIEGGRFCLRAERWHINDVTHGYVSLAALICEAGSERERELARVLQELLDTTKVPATRDDDPFLHDLRAEASRLLGWESK